MKNHKTPQRISVLILEDRERNDFRFKLKTNMDTV